MADETTLNPTELIEEGRADAAQASPEWALGRGFSIAKSYRQSPAYQERLTRLTEIVAAVTSGAQRMDKLIEAMSSSDFPLLFGDVLDRMLLGEYNDVPSDWRGYVRIARVRDFRTVKKYRVDGAMSPLLPVGPQEEYKHTALSESSYEYSVKKYGRKIGFDWESMINDDLDILTDIPRRFARASTRTERRFVTGLYAGPSGPLSTFYTVGNLNIITGNPVFSRTSLQAALLSLATARDADGEPILIEMVHLVVPPALEVEALNVLNSTQLIIGADTDAERMMVNNWMQNRLTLHVDPYLPIISSTANGNTSWYVFADPATTAPALEVAFLRGYEAPQVFVKAPDSIVLSGADPIPVDFDTDTQIYKVRHVFGGSQVDPSMTRASNGSGT